MNLILSVSNADQHLLPLQAQLIKHLGPNNGHTLTVVYEQEVSPTEIEGFCKEMQGLFDSVESVQVTTRAKGWPLGANQMFREVAKIAAKKGEVWYNYELDNTFTRSNALTILEREYHREQKPFMGAVVPTRGFVQQGDKVTPQTFGEHMVGTGIYPPGYAAASVKLPFVDRQFMWGDIEPYDIAIRFETTPFAHPTKLIQHNLRTVNYRKEGDQIVCDNAPNNAQSHAKPVDPQAVVVHGCKDGSLAKLIMGGADTSKVKAPEPVTTVAPEPQAPSVPTSLGKPPSFLAVQVINLLKTGGGFRVKQLAEKLQVDEKVLREAIEDPSSTLEITTPGWVRQKTAVLQPV